MINRLKTISGNKYNSDVLLNFLFRIISTILSLVYVKLCIMCLGANEYGLWATISSVVSWMGCGDLGIGNGIRNQVAYAYGKNNDMRIKSIIATGANCIIVVAGFLFAIMILICEILFRIDILDISLRIPMYITGFIFCINMILGISQSISFGYQKSWLVSLTYCIGVLISCCSVGGLIISDSIINLVTFSIVNGICMLLPNVLLLVILKREDIVVFSPIIKKYYNSLLKDEIVTKGIGFFIIQISALVLYSTDNVIINYLFNGSAVTEYSIITKIYETGSGFFSILLISLWSAVTFHASCNDYKWIYSKLKQLLKIWLFFSFGVIFVSISLNNIVKIWLGNNAVIYENNMILLFCIYCLLTTFSAIFVNILNGLGIIKLQIVLSFCAAIVNVPLSIYLAKICNLGILGVKLGTFLCIIITSIFIPVQTIVFLKRRLKIYNK